MWRERQEIIGVHRTAEGHHNWPAIAAKHNSGHLGLDQPHKQPVTSCYMLKDKSSQELIFPPGHVPPAFSSGDVGQAQVTQITSGHIWTEFH